MFAFIYIAIFLGAAKIFSAAPAGMGLRYAFAFVLFGAVLSIIVAASAAIFEVDFSRGALYRPYDNYPNFGEGYLSEETYDALSYDEKKRRHHRACLIIGFIASFGLQFICGEAKAPCLCAYIQLDMKKGAACFDDAPPQTRVIKGLN